MKQHNLNRIQSNETPPTEKQTGFFWTLKILKKEITKFAYTKMLASIAFKPLSSVGIHCS